MCHFFFLQPFVLVSRLILIGTSPSSSLAPGHLVSSSRSSPTSLILSRCRASRWFFNTLFVPVTPFQERGEPCDHSRGCSDVSVFATARLDGHGIMSTSPSCLHIRLMAHVTVTAGHVSKLPSPTSSSKHFNEQHCLHSWEASTEALSVVNAKGLYLGQLLLSDEGETSMFISAAGCPKHPMFIHTPMRGDLEHSRAVHQLCSLCWFGETDKTESRRDVTCSGCLFDASAIVKTFSA